MKVSWRGGEDSQTHKASTLMVLNKTEVAAATEEQASCEYNEPTQHCAVFCVVVCVRPSTQIYIFYTAASSFSKHNIKVWMYFSPSRQCKMKACSNWCRNVSLEGSKSITNVNILFKKKGMLWKNSLVNITVHMILSSWSISDWISF